MTDIFAILNRKHSWHQTKGESILRVGREEKSMDYEEDEHEEEEGGGKLFRQCLQAGQSYEFPATSRMCLLTGCQTEMQSGQTYSL